MSDTWIKLRDDLDTNPRLARMASYLAATAASYVLPSEVRDLFGSVTKAVTRHAMRDVTFAGLTRVWRHANLHTHDGIFHGVTLDYLDDLSHIPGFGAAMQLVGWVHYDPENDTLTLPNFTEHNAPDKNGARSQTASARRAQRYRDKIAALKLQPPDPPVTDPVNDVNPAHPPPPKRDGVTSRVTPPVTAESVTPPVTDDVTPSISFSSSLSESEYSESGKEESRGENPPAPPPPSPLSTLEEAKRRINRLRGSWAKLPHWGSEEEHALSAALQNLQAMEDNDWRILAYWLRWAHSSANQQSKDPVRVTSRRHTFVTELAANYDRAVTHWKQTGSPRLNADGTKAGAKIVPFKQEAPAEPELPPAANAAAFAGLLAANGVNVRHHPTVTTKPLS